MNADFTSSERRADPCCGGSRAGDERREFRSALEFHRATRTQTLAMVQELSQGQIDYAPAPSKWSVGEVLDHLILGQRLYLSYIEEVIGMNLFLPNGVRDFMTRNRVVPAQNPNIATPRHGRSTNELRNDLISSLKETEALLESRPDLDYGEMMIQHPLLGNNTVPGMLRFLALHEQRHQSQIKSVLASPGFPISNLTAAEVPHVE